MSCRTKTRFKLYLFLLFFSENLHILGDLDVHSANKSWLFVNLSIDVARDQFKDLSQAAYSYKYTSIKQVNIMK